jgi:hypothetical protein
LKAIAKVMSQSTRKFFAVILLVLLIGLPLVNWQLGALLWMCAWLIFIFQKLFPGHIEKFGDENNERDDPE